MSRDSMRGRAKLPGSVNEPVKLPSMLQPLRWILVVLPIAMVGAMGSGIARSSHAARPEKNWIGTWATAAQPSLPGIQQNLRNQTLRLIVHTSAAGKTARIRISNTYGDQQLRIGSAHIARRMNGADIEPDSDRKLTFSGQSSISIPAKSSVVSDPADLDAPALSDLAISLFFPEPTAVTTSHLLAQQTNYVSAEGDFTATVKFPIGKTIRSWPFLTGVDVLASPRGATIVAFGSSLTDGDGSTLDANRRWPDVLAERLQKAGGSRSELGVVNLGIIGNRLLHDSPANSPFGAALGESGLGRFERDVLAQPGVKYVVIGLGINDIAFPAFPFVKPSEKIAVMDIIAGYRQLILRAHRKGIRVIGTTITPFEKSFFKRPPVEFYTAEREAVRQEVNAWILKSGAFDAVVDFASALGDPNRPAQVRPEYDSGDHLHANDAGYVAQANAISLKLFEAR